jgi:hypothetical protein
VLNADFRPLSPYPLSIVDARDAGAGDIRGEKSKAQQQCHIGRAQLLSLRRVSNALTRSAAELFLEMVRADQQSDQLGIWPTPTPGRIATVSPALRSTELEASFAGLIC